jgi:hypothetical protein
MSYDLTGITYGKGFVRSTAIAWDQDYDGCELTHASERFQHMCLWPSAPKQYQQRFNTPDLRIDPRL